MVVCLERGADLHMVQLMPLPLTVSCFIWRFTRDPITVPASLNAHTALQLCSDYRLLLLL